MKGLLLAGGHGTRLRPLTSAGNKHMLPIANKPMLLYGLEHLRSAGVKRVGIVLGPIKEGVMEMIGDGSELGLEVTYLDQPEPKGLAHAVLISEKFIGKEPFVMYLGDNLLKQGIADFLGTFNRGGLDCVVGVMPTENPSRFGVVEMKNGRPTKLVEKPKEPKSNLALVGVYVFNSSIFRAVKAIRPSWRNELEITDAIQYLIDEGKKVEAVRVKGWWKDTGRPEDLLEANQLVLADIQTDVRSRLSSKTTLTGRVSIARGSRFVGAVHVRGPAIIGERCAIGPNVYVGPYTSIGGNCKLKNVEIENSIVMEGCQIESNRRIADSLIGGSSMIANGEKMVPRGYKLILGERSFVQG